MAAITAELALEVSKFQGSLRQAQDSLRGFRSRAQRQGDHLGQSLFSGVGKAAAGIGAVLAAGLAAFGIGKAVSGAIGRAVQAEQLQVSFDVLVGDASKAKETIASLRKLGAETPFEFPELAEAGKKLIAFGEGADSVTGTLRRIGDISSGIQTPIGDIAEIYGKARVQGRLFAEDINQLTGRGIPVIQEFAKQLGVADAEVKQMASAGKLTFGNLEQAFVSLTSEGGKFGGMMARQSRTVGGLWSTFKDTVGELLLSFGQPINDALRPLLDEAIEQVGALTGAAARAGTAVAGAMKSIVAFFQEFSAAEMGRLFLDSLVLAFKRAANFLISALVGVARAAGSIFTDVFSVFGKAEFWEGMLAQLMAIATAFVNKVEGPVLDSLEWMGVDTERRMARNREMEAQFPDFPKLAEHQGMFDEGPYLRKIDRYLKANPEARTAAEGFDRRWGGRSESQAEALGSYSRQLLDEATRDQKDISSIMRDAATAFGDSLGGGLFDTSNQEKALGEAAARIRARIAAADAKAEQLQKENAQNLAGSAGKQTGTPAGTAGASNAAPKLAPGVFASAINLVMGRSANELILDETKKQTAAQHQMADQLKQINDKLTPKPTPQKPAAPVPVVDTVPRFA